MDKQPLLIFLVIAALFLAASLFLLSRINSTCCRLIVSAVAGLLTYFTVGVTTSLAAPDSLVSSLYFRLFGLAPFIAHAVDRNYTEQEGLVIKMPWIGIWTNWLVVILFWSLLFSTLYFFFVRRLRQTM